MMETSFRCTAHILSTDVVGGPGNGSPQDPGEHAELQILKDLSHIHQQEQIAEG